MNSFVFLLTVGLSSASLHRIRRGAYMSPYSRPNYGDNQWGQNQNNYNPYHNWNDQNQWGHSGYHNSYQSNYGVSSSYGPPRSSYGPPKPTYSPPRSSYGRPEPTYSPYSRPTSSYGRPPQFNVPPPVVPNVDTPPVSQPVVPPEAPVPPVAPVAPVAPVVPIPPPVPTPPQVVPSVPTPPMAPVDPIPPVPGPVAPSPSTGPLFGGVEPGAGALAPGEAPPPPPTDEEMTRVDAAEKENEVRKARGGPPGINVDAIAETGTLPPQASVPDIPMPPSK